MRLKALLLLVAIPTALGVSSIDIQLCKRNNAVVSAAQLEETKCLATMVYGEARGETYKGKIAVAYSAINRKARNGTKSLCDIVLAPKQYSIFNGNSKLQKVATTFDIAPPTKNELEQAAWDESWQIAVGVMEKKYQDPVKGATHYVAWKAIKQLGYRTPKWALQYTEVGSVDNHTFYVPYYPKKSSKKVTKKT